MVSSLIASERRLATPLSNPSSSSKYERERPGAF
jgi:hypothetical protein